MFLIVLVWVISVGFLGLALFPVDVIVFDSVGHAAGLLYLCC